MKLIMGALLVSGLALGCAVDDPTVDDPTAATSEPDVSETEQESVVWCNGQVWRVNFYAEPSLTTYIGYIACNSCYGPQTRGGSTSNYTSLAYNWYCDLN